MLTLMHQNANVPPPPFPALEVLLAEPFPHTPQEMLQLAQRLSTAAAQTADQMVLVQLTRAHEAEACVTQAMAQARAQSPVPLVHKGFRRISVLLLGGTRLVLETPSLREDRRGRRGRRRPRGPHGAGCDPVLEVLGIADRVSPAGPGVRRVASGAYQHRYRRDQEPSAGCGACGGLQAPGPPQ